MPVRHVFLIPGFPADEADTNCLPAVQNYVEAYAAAHPEIDVHVVAFQYPYERRRYTWHGATVHALGGGNRRGWRRLGTWFRAWRVVRRIVQRGGVRVLHAFWLGEAAAMGQWLSARYRIPLVASIAGQDALPENPYLRMLRLDRMTITAGSAFAARRFEASAGRAVDEVIPLGLDVHRLPTAATEANRDVDVLGVGSLIPLKDFATFVDVIARLVDDFPEMRACLVGEGAERDAIASRIEAQRLGRHITLKGKLSREEVLRMMRRSRVLLHPARYEGQGYVFLEALSSGMAVVCRHVGHLPETDSVARCDDVGGMADAVRAFLQAPDDTEPVAVPVVAETVEAFEGVYEGLGRAM